MRMLVGMKNECTESGYPDSVHSFAGWDTDHTPLSLGLMAHRPRGRALEELQSPRYPRYREGTDLVTGDFYVPKRHGGSTTNEIRSLEYHRTASRQDTSRSPIEVMPFGGYHTPSTGCW